MKHLYYYIWAILLLPQNFMAQQALESKTNVPRPGDAIIKQEIAWFDPGAEGPSQTWDFSNIESSGNEYPVVYFERDGHLFSAESRYLYHYRFSGDSLLLTAREDAGGIILYHQPQLLLKFPLTYSSRVQSAVSGKGKYGDRMEIFSEGMVESVVDGKGTLILPGGDTLTNTSRVHIRKKLHDRYAALPVEFNINEPGGFNREEMLDSCYVETELYLWYAEGYRYPVMETAETRIHRENTAVVTEKTAFLFHPYEQLAQLTDDPENELLLIGKEELRSSGETAIKESAINNWVEVYPNPVRDHLRVTVSLPNPASLQLSLFDMSGKLIYQSAETNTSGEAVETIDMTSAPQGNYLLRIKAGDTVKNEKIVKQ